MITQIFQTNKSLAKKRLKLYLFSFDLVKNGQVAQLVEQRTENPCVAGSIPALATISLAGECRNWLSFLKSPKLGCQK